VTCRRITWTVFIAFALCGVPAVAQTPQKAESGKPAAVPRAGAQPSVPAPPQKVEAQAQLDRTALWVGDRLTYTVELTCQPGVDILADDLTPDKLKLDGLKIIGNDTNRSVTPGNVTTYRFRYYLATYSVDATTLTIGALDVRYYVQRAGQRLEDTAPAGDVEVPAAAVAVRSLLPDNQKSYAIRDARPAAARSLRYTILQPIGIGLVLISIVPALFFAATLARRFRGRVRRSPRQVRDVELASLNSVRSLDLTTVEGRREAYVRVNSLVRDHLRDICGVNAPNLTPAEIGPALTAHGAQLSTDLVTSVLTACELALYSPVELLPSAETCRQTLKHAEEVLASGQ
jgi:hypothetical protein